MHALSHPRAKKTFRVLLIVIALLALLIALPAIAVTSPFFAAKLGPWLTHQSGRNVALEGHIEAHWAREPRFVLHGVKVGNAEWSAKPDMFEASRIEFSIRPWELLRGRLVIPELVLEQPRLLLEKNAEGKANWNFSQNPQAAVLKEPVPESRYSVPIISRLRITDGTLTYQDAAKHTDTTVDVSTVSGNTGAEDSIHISGKGNYENAPFLLDLTGGSVLQLRETGHPYPFALRTTVGKTSAEVEGTVQDPVTLDALDVKLTLEGANAAELFPLTGIALPPTPPYQLTGHLTRDGEVWRFQEFTGRLGGSDLKGNIAWHAAEKPPYFEGAFVSDNLDMADLSGLIGANHKPADTDRVLPDTPLDISRLTAMNADVTFHGRHVKTPDLLDDFYLKAALKDGVLKLEPVSFGIAKGKIEANVTIEGLKTPPMTTVDVTFHRLSLASLFAPLSKKYGEENVSAGLLGGKAELRGSGKSLHEMLANANGRFGMGMEGGRLSRLLLELVGLDIFRAAGLVLTGDEPVAIHCVVGDFGVKSGLMQTREFLIDTDVTTLRGEGTIDLHDEKMDMRMNVFPKDASPLSARTPILLRGTLKHPKVGVDAAALAARGGIAAALSVVLTPVGALLAFIEPGLGKDSDCSAFLQTLDSKARAAVPATQAK